MSTQEISKGIPNVNAIKENDNKHIWSTFFKLIKKSKLPYGWIAITFILGLTSSRLSLLFPDYAQRVVEGDTSNKTIVIFAIVLLLSSVVYILISIISGITNAKITKGMRVTIWKEITNIPIHILEKENAKELISRTTTDTTALSLLLSTTLPNIVSAVYLMVGTIVAVQAYHISLMISLVLLVLLQLAVTVIIGRINYKYSDKVQLQLAKLTEHLSEVLANIPLVKVFVTEGKEERRGKKYIDKYFNINFKYQALNSTMIQLIFLVNVIGVLVVIVTGVLLVNKKAITMSQWLAYFMYYEMLQNSVSTIPFQWRDVKAAQGVSRRISEIACLEKEDYESGLAFKPSNKGIVFKNVKFGYENKSVLNGFSVNIPYGKTTALVGENGAGKSTILSLVERFYYPSDGEIAYGDTDITKFKLKDWRRTFGYVSQDIKLMTGTVYENITYGVDRDVTKSEVEEACRQADALEFVNSLEKGFDTQVGEFGYSLSGGQRQRVCIVRAILNNPEILLLDEFTSNLDIEAQENVERALDELCKGKTTIVIAHKMSTVKKADNIVVIKNGCVDGIGNHKMLLQSNELYKKLVNMQELA